MKSIRLLAGTAIMALLANTALAQSGAETIVTGTRIPTSTQNTATSITVVTAADIERKQYRNVAEALRDVPGVRVVELGGPNRLTSVFMRGSESNHTLALIDGIEANDPSNPTGQFDLSSLALDNIDRIEVLRGPQSAIYGSKAVGGVINIITKKGQGAPRTWALAEVGTLGTFNQRAGFSWGAEKFAISTEVANSRTDGDTATSKRYRANRQEETDGYERTSGTLRLDFYPDEVTDITLIGRASMNRFDLDDTGAEDPNREARNREESLRGRFKREMFGGAWEPSVTAGYTRNRRLTKDSNNPGSTEEEHSFQLGERKTIATDHIVRLIPNHKFVLGASHDEEEYKDAMFINFGGFIVPGNTTADRHTNAFYAEDQFSYLDRFFVNGSIRRDKVETFDGETTWRIAPAYLHTETDTKLKGSYGTSFRAPALYQMFGRTNGFTGNPNLVPETGKGWELGFEQGVLDSTLKFGATYFRNDIKNLIQATGFPSVPRNVARAEIDGYEAFTTFQVTKNLGIGANYTFTSSRDINGAALLRRPQHTASANVNWQVMDAWNVSADVVYVGEMRDVSATAGTTVYLGGYSIVNLATSYELNPNVRLFGRVNNLLNREYQTADGFQGVGAELLTGVRVSF